MRRYLSLLLTQGPKRVYCEMAGHDWGPWSDEFAGLPARTCRRCREVEVR